MSFKFAGHGCEIRRARRRLCGMDHPLSVPMLVAAALSSRSWQFTCARRHMKQGLCSCVSLAFCCKKSLIRLSFPTLSCLGFGMDLVSTLARWISSCSLQLLLWPKLHILTSSASIVPKIATRLATSRHMIKFVGHVSANATYVRFPKGLQSNTQYYCLHLRMLYGWCVLYACILVG